MAQQQTIKFFGGIAKRVWILFQENNAVEYNHSDYDFVQKRFNSLRNYREFVGERPVEIKTIYSDNLPRITSLKEGDVCLIIGSGRCVDKSTYTFAGKCFSHNIPVFFIRKKSLDCDPRLTNPIWKYNVMTTNLGSSTKNYQAPDQYFMQIPRIEDFILTKTSKRFYALLPAMVPVR